MKLSKYVRCVNYKDDVILYNTINHAIIQLPKETVENDILLDMLDEESVSSLGAMGYFSDTDMMVEQNLNSYLINDNKLFISIELNLSCNLRCPYCYQSGEHNGKKIDKLNLDLLVDYIYKVHSKTSFTDLFVKILGGEPTLVWEDLEYINERLFQLCKLYGIKYHLLVDTNGTIIDKLIKLENYDSLLLTIPLTYKKCHDKVRFDANGQGTYEKIINNINIIKDEKPNTKIVLRYNVDQDNISYFKSFLEDICESLRFKPLISVNYTAELNGKSEYDNPLSYTDFVNWSSTIAIDNLLEMGLPITISPIVSIEECQFRSKYSMKLFSDGTVGSCAMDFFAKDRIKLSDLIEWFDADNEFWNRKIKQTILVDKSCLQCDSLFLCGGTNKLPCIQALDKTLCNKKLFSINLKDFLTRYVDSLENGVSDLFVVFNDGESYR